MNDMVSKDYYLKDYECGCGCGYARPKRGIVETVQALRDFTGIDIAIVAGCMCTAEYDVAPCKNHGHVSGEAADIGVDGGDDGGRMFGLVKTAYQQGKLPYLTHCIVVPPTSEGVVHIEAREDRVGSDDPFRMKQDWRDSIPGVSEYETRGTLWPDPVVAPAAQKNPKKGKKTGVTVKAG